MLIIVPPSEAKHEPLAGAPVDLESLSFGELNPTRERVLAALGETSAAPDALRRLRVGPGLLPEVARNIGLREQPAAPAAEVYAGALHQALGVTSLSRDAAERARRSVIIVSSLWGALQVDDRIPAYRLHICSLLTDLGRLEPVWRNVLPEVLARAAGERRPILDLRSPIYEAVGMPAGLADDTVSLHVPAVVGGQRIGNVGAKQLRGEIGRHLLEAESEPGDVHELALIVSQRWDTRLERAARAGRGWTLHVRPS